MNAVGFSFVCPIPAVYGNCLCVVLYVRDGFCTLKGFSRELIGALREESWQSDTN